MSDVFSPYQIDYSVKNASKTFGFSKKRVTFKFGIANPPAVASGALGASCRGSEHEIIFIWSLNSGKRQILCDGKDVHYSETGQNGWTADQVFQHQFEVRVAGLAGPLRAHLITQPANRDVPHIKPFDLRLNGISYFAMPQIYQLGTPQTIVRPVKGKPKMHHLRGQGYGGNSRNEDDAHLSPAEKQAIAAAKLASMQDLNRSGNAAPAVVDDLISFDAPAPGPVPPNPYGQPPPPMQPQYNNYSLGAPPAPQGGYGYPPPQQQMQQSQQGAFYGGQPSHAQAPAPGAYNHQQQQQFMSPNAKSVTSYQSYGSAPSFAQPPQQQNQQQYQQQYQQGSYYGQPPQAPQGY
mmetsp:Transcript_24019/g.56696  ORF Transcript_24019/g.56696 Transcript_24019/m.56696 type:complete len:349 (+) Transcript_24019:315-1361(+)|eukprot:CAMPEP_0197182048 /NCGR_PEP_ID=MMETSP1423-20130617/6148_1 /TAXON_ID=476441 /ORGANISM="Pseudo-nitzschia heimii, Strain UNC1101" /LENGTH=348 /DNA_ID=CAMNT_0042632417 /DNA_START=230 /DNA_END=1276 /DNA_ORIENTATION=+